MLSCFPPITDRTSSPLALISPRPRSARQTGRFVTALTRVPAKGDTQAKQPQSRYPRGKHPPRHCLLSRCFQSAACVELKTPHSRHEARASSTHFPNPVSDGSPCRRLGGWDASLQSGKAQRPLAISLMRAPQFLRPLACPVGRDGAAAELGAALTTLKYLSRKPVPASESPDCTR